MKNQPQSRREFIKRGAIFVPATFGIIGLVPKSLVASIINGPVGGTPVSITKDTIGDTSDTRDFGTVASSTKYLAHQWTVTTGYTFTGVIIRLQRNGAGTAGTLTAELRADSSGSPSGTVTDTSSNSFTSAQITGGSFADYTFTFANRVLSGSAVWWINTLDATPDNTNYYTMNQNTGSPAGKQYFSTDGSSWGSYSTRQGYLRIQGF